MIKTKINLAAGLCLMIFSCSAYCQTTYIFKDDSLLVNKYMSRFENLKNESHIINRFLDFKEKLPDGIYIYVWLNRKDSAKKDLKDYVYMKGQYQDSLRQGKFEYYDRLKVKGKWENKLMRLYTYKDGLLNGYHFANNSAYRYEEGYYKEGKRHGFFITYDFYGGGDLQEIELYEENILKYKVTYKDGEMQQLNTNPCPREEFKINEGHNMPLRIESPCND